MKQWKMTTFLVLVGVSLGVWPDSAKGQTPYGDELVLIKVRTEAVAEMKTLWQVSWVGIEAAQARQAGRPQTGFHAFDAVGTRFGLLWIQRTYESWSNKLARRIYVLHFPSDSPLEAIVAAYEALSFIQAIAVDRIPEEWLIEDSGEHSYYTENVLIKVRTEAVAEMETIWQVSSLDEQEALKLGTHTGLGEFDAIAEQFGLLWIERTYDDKQLYGLHFPLGSPVETLIAVYAQLPFVEYAEPGYIPIELLDDTAAENVTWGRIKHQINH